jgi:glyoxylase I family protein
MTHATSERSTAGTAAKSIAGFHGVRYLVTDVKRAVEFYTTQLGFRVEREQLPAFASVSLGSLTILLSGPEASGSRPVLGGEHQQPGGSNRVVLRVKDLREAIHGLREYGAAFRNEIETGPGGSQIQVLDPDGNPIELFEPAAR